MNFIHEFDILRRPILTIRVLGALCGEEGSNSRGCAQFSLPRGRPDSLMYTRSKNRPKVCHLVPLFAAGSRRPLSNSDAFDLPVSLVKALAMELTQCGQARM